MKPRGRKPSPLHGRGEIRGDAVYPISVLMRRLGIARNTLTSLRRRGLPVRNLGRRCSIIDGGELLRFLRSEWAKQDRGINDASDQAGNHGESAATVPGNGTSGGQEREGQ